VITSADILSAKNFEIAQLNAAYSSAQATHAEVQAWRLYIIDLDHCRLMTGVAAAVGPAVAAAVGPAVNAAMQPFMKTLAMTHNRLTFLQSINRPLMEVSNDTGESPGPLFPATVAEFEGFTNAQLDALAEFYGIAPVNGLKMAKQRLLRPIIGDYRTDQ